MLIKISSILFWFTAPLPVQQSGFHCLEAPGHIYHLSDLDVVALTLVTAGGGLGLGLGLGLGRAELGHYAFKSLGQAGQEGAGRHRLPALDLLLEAHHSVG